jgi:glycolate oxidase FAD binding subunit
MSVIGPRLGREITGYAGNGIILTKLTGESMRLIDAIQEIRLRVGQRGTVVLRHASPKVKQAVDVWGTVGDALALMKSVKARFDPEGIMNPGRFVAGI